MRLLLGFMLTLSAAAQTPRVPLDPKPVYGSVSGIITCTDTNLPARLTSLTLQPIREGVPAKQADSKAAQPILQVLRTNLDGTFVIPRVRIGRYYVVVQKPGYLSPVAQFTKAEIDDPANPADDVSDAVAKLVPMVTVAANRTATVNIGLVRAATFTGVVKFDDGTPVPTQDVTLQHKDGKGKWTNVGTRSRTDDQGRYRISGVPAGEYRMLTKLELDEKFTDAVFGDSSSSTSQTKANIDVFFGDTFRRKEAKLYKVDDGQEVSADLTIPNSRLHHVSGSLVDARTGRTINAGTIRLTFADDDEQSIASVAVDDDEPTFTLPFVPQGIYTVSVTDARDVTRVPVVFPEDTVRIASPKETVLKTYGKYEGTLTVQSDVTGLVLAIPAKGAS